MGNMNKKAFRILGIFFIIIGLAAISYGVYYKQQTAKVQEHLINDFETVLKKIENPNKEQIKDNNSLGNIKPIALLEIPKIGLKVAVAEGTEDEVISYAVGHFTGTALPGENGNCALVGHRNYTTGEFFLKIDKLKAGDDIIITDQNNTYNYKVTSQQVVGPKEVEVLNPTKEATITLVTCTWNGQNRLIVKGELVK